MKNKYLIAAVALASLGGNAWAAPITIGGSQTDNTMIRDDDLNGVSEVINLGATGIQSITDVTLTLNISGGFNGDYYAYLMHDGVSAVLLNRVGGLGALNPYGYADSGFNVTFSDSAANGDIHLYQNVVNPNGGPITGTWQPDGRTASPFTTSDGGSRTALLNVLDGVSADGDWTLFIADTSPGDIGFLDSWSLQVTGTPAETGDVPDAGSTLGLLGGAFGFLALARRRIRRA